ncbi:hypothetical protein [Pseudomonas sp. St316]|uniref:hypothetical protein n=1 Tax=Pseudomonas sp. St316 TaxID=2678257 RepID=UPI001BB35E12|nr:hypothetical protein [Pseudomonas sp. St316]BBP60108.1 hypothetical protein PHLH4_36980 [Pseudomonas sp. St316]
MSLKSGFMRDGGKKYKEDLFLKAVPSSERITEVFYAHNLTGARLELVKQICIDFEKELSYLNEQLAIHRLDPVGWSLVCRFLSQDNFYAEVGKCAYVPKNYEIRISLGVPATVLSVAIELISLQVDSESSHLGKQYGGSSCSVESLFPGVTSVSEIGGAATNLALDVCLLLYFHEVAHMVFGHCDYRPRNSKEVRALEFDADFNAGSIFGSLVMGLPSAIRRPSSSSELVERLIRAAFVLGVIFKAVSRESENYHYPSVRVASFMSGGVFSMTKNGHAPEFSDDGEGDKYWEQIVRDVQAPLLDALRRSSLSRFSGTEIEIQRDWDELNSVTYKVRNELKDGPLATLRVTP